MRKLEDSKIKKNNILICPFCGSKEVQINTINIGINFQCVNKNCWASVYFFGQNEEELLQKYERRDKE